MARETGAIFNLIKNYDRCHELYLITSVKKHFLPRAKGKILYDISDHVLTAIIMITGNDIPAT